MIDDGQVVLMQMTRIPFTEMKLDRAFVCRGNQAAAAFALPMVVEDWIAWLGNAQKA